MGGAVRLKRSNSGNLSASDRSFDEDEEDEDSFTSSKSPEPKRRKSTLWESSPKRNVQKKKISELVTEVIDREGDLNKTKLNQVISSKRSSSCSIRSTDSAEYVQSDRALSSSSSDSRLTLLKPWSLEDFTLGKALGKVENLSKETA